MPKHLKIMSNDKIIFNGDVGSCSECRLFQPDISEGLNDSCGVAGEYISDYDTVGDDCPLEDKVD